MLQKIGNVSLCAVNDELKFFTLVDGHSEIVVVVDVEFFDVVVDIPEVCLGSGKLFLCEL